MSGQFMVLDPVEKTLVESEFKRVGLEFTFVPKEDSIVGAEVATGGVVGIFEVSDEDAALAREIVDNVHSEKVHSEPPGGGERNWFQKPSIMVPWAMAFVLAVVLGFQMFENSLLSRSYNRVRITASHKSVLSDDKKTVTRYFNDTGLVEGIFYDQNFNNHYEREDIYDRKGRLVYRVSSTKDDGFFNLTEGYDGSGNLLWKDYDPDSAKRTTKTEYFLPDSSVLTLDFATATGAIKSVVLATRGKVTPIFSSGGSQ